MDRIRIEEFRGLYTNADEADLNPQYQVDSINLRQRAGYVESEGYTAKRIGSVENIIFSEEVELDADRQGIKLEDDELIPFYSQSFERLLLVQNERLNVYLGEENIGKTDSEIIKLVNNEGIVKVLTKDGTIYWIGNISRYYRLGDGAITFVKKKIMVPYIDLESQVTSFFNYTTSSLTEIRDVFFTFEGIDIAGTTIIFEFNVYFSEANEFYKRVRLAQNQVDPTMLELPEWFREEYNPKGSSWGVVAPNNLISLQGFLDLDITLNYQWNAADYGFDKISFDVLVTCKYDDNDEYVVFTQTIRTEFAPKYLITGKVKLKQQFNKRVTSINVYLRFRKDDDYELASTLNFTLGKIYTNYENLIITSLSPSGVFLSQMIGAVYDKRTYKPIVKFEDYIELSGVSYSLYQSRVYHASVGGGKVMKGVFYDYIPEVQGKFLVDVNGSLGVFDKQLTLVVPQDSGEGFLLFSEKDKMSFDVKDQYDFTVSPEGILIHTSRGIYATNGYERKLISEPINNIVEKNFDNGNIFYNQNDEMLFYVSNGGVYRYDFVYDQWTQLSIVTTGKFFFGKKGEIYAYEDGILYQLTKDFNVLSKIRTPENDLEYPSILKSILYVIVDFEGELIHNYSIRHTKRKTVQLGVPIDSRVPRNTVGTELYFKGKIYSIEIYYDIVGEMRNADFIPSPEILAEGIPELATLIEYQKSLQTGA